MSGGCQSLHKKGIFFFFFKTHHYTRAVEKQEMDYLMVFDHRDKIKPQVDEGVHCNPERTLNFLFQIEKKKKKSPESEIVSLLKAVVSKEEGKNNEKKTKLFSLLRSVPVSAASEVSCRRVSKECGSRAEHWTSPSLTVDPKVCPGTSASHTQSSLAGRR